MFITEVKDSAAARAFIQLPRKLYREDKNWICPLENDVNDVFNPEKNTFFTHGSLCRWLLKNDRGETIGRVAAFINERKIYMCWQDTKLSAIQNEGIAKTVTVTGNNLYL